MHPAYAAAGLGAEAAAAKCGLPVLLHLLPLLVLHLTLFDCRCRYKLLPDFWWSRSTKSAPKPCEQQESHMFWDNIYIINAGST